MKKPIMNYERLFKITCKKNTVCLIGSMSVVNGKASEENFENEVYKLTFLAVINGLKINQSLMVTANECFCEMEIEKLKNQLGIILEGDGMSFEIVSYKHDFTLQFDQLNSVFLDTDTVKNGQISFLKQ